MCQEYTLIRNDIKAVVKKDGNAGYTVMNNGDLKFTTISDCVVGCVQKDRC
jgi:hypothetical protein